MLWYKSNTGNLKKTSRLKMRNGLSIKECSRFKRERNLRKKLICLTYLVNVLGPLPLFTVNLSPLQVKVKEPSFGFGGLESS